jgi:DNA-binding transcriptional ArsR family regulator
MGVPKKILGNQTVTDTFVTVWLPNSMRRDVFQAIADPTRRDIIKLLSRRQLNLNAIADQFDISRPAVSKHIKILSECGLVGVEQLGRERRCTAQLKQLSQVAHWVAQYDEFWIKKLDALERHLTNPSRKSKQKQKSKNKI